MNLGKIQKLIKSKNLDDVKIGMNFLIHEVEDFAKYKDFEELKRHIGDNFRLDPECGNTTWSDYIYMVTKEEHSIWLDSDAISYYVTGSKRYKELLSMWRSNLDHEIL